ncbi:MAG: KEOPS complex subunit Pcc1 [Hadesarchaea archaeon]|nr:KEOPS complex subunit Pcc1 [Hadesarchaea archaeon]MDH5685643.1 KEOPS complex subunit Pcc1 [Hadesarchaea archaeon]
MVKAKQASATVEFTFRTAREAGAVQQALKPEEALPASTRCRTSIRRRKNVLCLRVDAEDTAALRAALNSFLRWAIVARDMIEPRRK